MNRRPQLTWSEREARAVARRQGQHAITYLRQVLAYQHQADQWQQLADQAGVDATNAAYWRQNVDRAVGDMLHTARRAWRLALQLQGEAARR
jgi:hypothetical protein